MTPLQMFHRFFLQCPLVAIIRGVTSAEAQGIGRAVFEGGIRIIEVPLNSPEPFESIRILAEALGDEALIGAGTVLDPADVERVRSAGGRIIVSPNTNRQVIEASVKAGMVSSPGFYTPSEALLALDCGAHALKFFPAEAASPAVVKALRAVLPRQVPLLVVGGVSPESIGPWLGAGADGFGLGGGLYKPGQSAEETRSKALAFVEAVKSRCGR
jgi:2-dehydro-3-deoxyphosphogalactonate aldolase